MSSLETSSTSSTSSTHAVVCTASKKDQTNSGDMSVAGQGRKIAVRVSHIGIDEDFIRHIMRGSSHRKLVDSFKEESRHITNLARKNQAVSPQTVPGGRSSSNLMPYR